MGTRLPCQSRTTAKKVAFYRARRTGIAASSLLALESHQPSAAIYSDRLNSVNFLNSLPCSFVDSLLANSVSAHVDTYHVPLIPSPLFDATPPPSYSYFKAVSSFSAIAQLYLRCGQLDAYLTLTRRLADGPRKPTWCRFGCHAIEDPHHIFVHCPRFRALPRISHFVTGRLLACNYLHLIL